MLVVRSMANGIVPKKGILVSLQAEQKLVNLLVKLLPDAAFLVGGTRLTSAQAAAEVLQHITAENQVQSLAAQLREARTSVKRIRVRARAVRRVVQLVAALTLGDSSKDYQLLGFETPKQRKTSTAAKAKGVVKWKATRVARGTKGTKQKKAIHGTP